MQPQISHGMSAWSDAQHMSIDNIPQSRLKVLSYFGSLLPSAYPNTCIVVATAVVAENLIYWPLVN